MRLKDRVFTSSKPYDTKITEDLMKQTYGEKLRMYDLQGPRVFVTATAANRTPPDLHLFRNYPSPQSELEIKDFPHPDLADKKSAVTATPPSEQLVWRAARATGAAPSFFRPETNYVDGGIVANNPSLALLTEIAEFNVAKKALEHDEEVVKPVVLVSLGTGVPPVKKVIYVFDLVHNHVVPLTLSQIVPGILLDILVPRIHIMATAFQSHRDMYAALWPNHQFANSTFRPRLWTSSGPTTPSTL